MSEVYHSTIRHQSVRAMQSVASAVGVEVIPLGMRDAADLPGAN
jgi:hypothetical protein